MTNGKTDGWTDRQTYKEMKVKSYSRVNANENARFIHIHQAAQMRSEWNVFATILIG